jgi:hypothetical protein
VHALIDPHHVSPFIHSFIPTFGSAASAKRKQTTIIAQKSSLYFSFGVCSFARCISSVMRTLVMAHQVFLNCALRGSGLRRIYETWGQLPNFVCRGKLAEFFKPPVWHPQLFKVWHLEDDIVEEPFPLFALRAQHHLPISSNGQREAKETSVCVVILP